MKELKQCPFCQHGGIRFTEKTDFGMKYGVKCTWFVCNAQIGPWYPRFLARDAWNRRVEG